MPRMSKESPDWQEQATYVGYAATEWLKARSSPVTEAISQIDLSAQYPVWVLAGLGSGKTIGGGGLLFE